MAAKTGKDSTKAPKLTTKLTAKEPLELDEDLVEKVQPTPPTKLMYIWPKKAASVHYKGRSFTKRKPVTSNDPVFINECKFQGQLTMSEGKPQ